MKQLDNKASSPWEIKKVEETSPLLTEAWSKVHEEPEAPKPKYNNRFVCWRIDGLGSGAVNIGPLTVTAPPTFEFTLPGTHIILLFNITHVDDCGDGHYTFSGIKA